MGRPDQGNKAQTPVGYPHGTGVSTGGLVTTVTGVFSQVTLGVGGLCCYPSTSTARVSWGMARQDGRRVGPRHRPCRRGFGDVLPVDDDWCSRGGVGAAHEPREEINEGAEASPSSELTQGGIRATLGPRGRYGGNIGGRMAVLETLWWEY